MREKIRIMVVDDTITYRQILSKIVRILPDTELAGTASSGKTALMKLASIKPHLIFLDIMMPNMDGIETLRRIKEHDSNIQVIMVSGAEPTTAKATLDSLGNGALDFVAKPIASDMQEGITQLKEALEPLVEIVREKVFQPTEASPETIPELDRPITVDAAPTIDKKVDLVLIGVSTGGPNALHTLFKSIQCRLQCPILIVQHMPAVFTRSLAERLDKVTPLKVKEADDHEIPQAEHVYIAPGGKHMILRGKIGGSQEIRVIDSPPVNHCKPAVDMLFNSAANLENIDCLSIVMTGMGRDGTEGVRRLKKSGAPCLIQDKTTSVVWGMPGSIYEASLADEVLPLGKLGARIVELTAVS